MKLTVRSGDFKETVEAEDAFDAAVKAVKTFGFESLGLIMEVVPEGGASFQEDGDDGWFVSTERVLQAAGINYQRKDGAPKMEPKATTQ